MAANWGGYKLREFRAMEGKEQAEIVAAYRCKNQMEAVSSITQNNKAQAKSKAKSPPGRSKR